jgi:hypothetical protein
MHNEERSKTQFYQAKRGKVMQKVAVGIKFFCALEDEKISGHMGECEAAKQQA